ncbi:hypothetical protein M1146_00295 [Patescibacteria group bacterium]|nr:hypothetical protein [Patescibacteria group bacterium]
MITIIHGDDIASSRNYLLEQKDQSNNSLILEGKSITVNDLIQVVETGELFSTSKVLFIENFFSGRKPAKEFDAIIKYLGKKHLKNEIFFWEEKELTKKSLNVFANAKVKTFTIPKSLFVFLDSIKPGNGKNLIVIFHQSLENAQPEQIMYMIIRQIRLLLSFSELGNLEAIEEASKLAPWQKSKLEKQAKLFNPNSLREIYSKLFEIDLAQKTGALSMPLSQAIDFLLLDI